MAERTVEIAVCVALTVSRKTPLEQLDREFMVNPKGSYSGFKADKASFKSCRARLESKRNADIK